jgi:hypothetical protein
MNDIQTHLFKTYFPYLVAFLLGVLVVWFITLNKTQKAIGEKEAILNDLHEARISAYENQIVAYQKVITKLQAERDELRKKKQRVKVVTIREIDSVYALPFDGRADFWTKETARLDSVRFRYIGSNN